MIPFDRHFLPARFLYLTSALSYLLFLPYKITDISIFMAKLSRQTKEIIKTVLFFLAVALIVLVYVIYPLNRTKAIMARGDVDNYSSDSLVMNDPTTFIDAGLVADTFRFEPDGLANLACLFVPPSGDSSTEPKGTVFLIPGETDTRDSVIALAAALHDSDYAVYTYDQRASGRSTGKYRGDGTHEASDIQELISHFEIRGQIAHPLLIVGFDLGADAAMLAALEEKRIDAVVAVDPYLTTPHMQDDLRERFGTYWFPFYRTIMWWWYEIRSGYATIYRRIDDIKPVPCPTLLILPKDRLDGEEAERVKEISPADLLLVSPLPEDESAVYETILAFLKLSATE